MKVEYREDLDYPYVIVNNEGEVDTSATTADELHKILVEDYATYLSEYWYHHDKMIIVKELKDNIRSLLTQLENMIAAND